MNATAMPPSTFMAGAHEVTMDSGQPERLPEDEHFYEAVRRTAYFLWEQDGRPHGRHDDYYLKALEQHRRERKFDRWLEAGPEGE